MEGLTQEEFENELKKYPLLRTTEPVNIPLKKKPFFAHPLFSLFIFISSID